MIIIIAIILGILVAGIIIYAIFSNKDKNGTTSSFVDQITENDEEYIDNNGYYTDEEGNVYYTDMDIISTDSDGNPIVGYKEDGTAIIGTIYNGTGSIEKFSYTQDEVTELRAYGYTGDEIEQYEIEEKSAEELLNEAKLAMKKAYEEQWGVYVDSTSKGFKKLNRLTWLGLPKTTLPKNSKNEDGIYNGYEEIHTRNVDYVKVEPRGYQTFIKCTMSDGSSFFYAIDPRRYIELKDSGNIVLEVTFLNWEGQWFITDVVEKDVLQ